MIGKVEMRKHGEGHLTCVELTWSLLEVKGKRALKVGEAWGP